MKPVPFEYYAPTSVEEALDQLSELGYDGKILAGGQSLIAAMNFRMARPAALVDLNTLPELEYINPASNGGVSIGTMTRVNKVHQHTDTMTRFPLLAEVIPNIAHQQIRNRGTFGGSIAHADPAGQLPAVSVALNADLLIRGKGKERWVRAEEFFMGPFMTVLEPEEMLVEVVLPKPAPNTGSSYHQVSRQKGGYAQAASVTILTLESGKRVKDVRIVLISVNDTPVLSQKAREIMLGQEFTPDLALLAAKTIADQEIEPASDLHASADYRRNLTKVLIERSLNDAFKRAQIGG